MNIEHDTALLHMSTYIAERWHRAHGFCMCWGVEAPFVRNSTHTIKAVHVLAIWTTAHLYIEVSLHMLEPQNCNYLKDYEITCIAL